MNSDPKDRQATREVVRSPDRDDVHEQREPDQSTEGVVETPAEDVKSGSIASP